MTTTITVRLDKKLARQLDYAAKSRATTRSLIVRDAVGSYLTEPAKRKNSFLEVAGVVSSGKRDLSTNPKHLEGLGR